MLKITFLFFSQQTSDFLKLLDNHISFLVTMATLQVFCTICIQNTLVNLISCSCGWLAVFRCNFSHCSTGSTYGMSSSRTPKCLFFYNLLCKEKRQFWWSNKIPCSGDTPALQGVCPPPPSRFFPNIPQCRGIVHFRSVVRKEEWLSRDRGLG